MNGPCLTIHHVRRYGEAKDDRRTILLPASLHLYDFGMESIERLGKAKFEALYGVDLEAAIRESNARHEEQETAKRSTGTRQDQGSQGRKLTRTAA